MIRTRLDPQTQTANPDPPRSQTQTANPNPVSTYVSIAPPPTPLYTMACTFRNNIGHGWEEISWHDLQDDDNDDDDRGAGRDHLRPDPYEYGDYFDAGPDGPREWLCAFLAFAAVSSCCVHHDILC